MLHNRLLGGRESPNLWFVHFHIKNTPATAAFKLLMWCHWMQSLEEICTMDSASWHQHHWMLMVSTAFGFGFQGGAAWPSVNLHGWTASPRQSQPTFILSISVHLLRAVQGLCWRYMGPRTGCHGVCNLDLTFKRECIPTMKRYKAHP